MEQMLQKMMKRFPLFIAMGAMIVAASLVIGAINAGNALDYHAVDKVTREGSAQWAEVRAGVESTVVWLPYFKFLGLAMILGGITMALGVIATKLQMLGKEVLSTVPQELRVTIPPRPRTVTWMRLFMMMGMLIIIVGFIVSLGTAATASSVYSNPVTQIDAAATGSALLNDLASVHAAESWLEAFKFVGIAFLFVGIINGLSTIIFALRFQWNAIPEVARRMQAAAEPAAAE